MKQKRLIFLVIIVALIGMIVAAVYYFGVKKAKIFSQADTYASTMVLSPASNSVYIGENFDVDINIDAQGASVRSGSASINFDSEALEIVSVNKSNDFPTQLTKNIETGRLIYEAGIDMSANPLVPITGTAKLATVTFKAKKVVTTQVDFNFQAGVYEMDLSSLIDDSLANVLSSVTGGTYAILSQPVAPTVNLKINGSNGPITIEKNQSATLSWTSQNASSCNSSWGGIKEGTGSESTGSLTSTRTFTMTCTGAGGSAKDVVTVNVNIPGGPTVDLKVNNQDNSASIDSGQSATLSWSTTNSDRCSASEGWSGDKGTSGSEGTGNLSSSQIYVLTCSGPGGEAADSISVNINSTSEAPDNSSDENTVSESTTEETAVTNTPDTTDTPPAATDQSTSTAPSTSTQPSSRKPVAKLPWNIQPKTLPVKQSTEEAFKGSTVQPWVLWMLYAIIPAFLTGGAVYFFLKRKKTDKDDSII